MPRIRLREGQRLEMEKDLAVARRALYRALRVAEDGAYWKLEDDIRSVNEVLREIMDRVMKGQE